MSIIGHWLREEYHKNAKLQIENEILHSKFDELSRQKKELLAKNCQMEIQINHLREKVRILEIVLSLQNRQ